jgi:hypothetical protein
MESMNRINPSSTGIQSGINESNSIIERFSKIIHNQQPIQETIQPDIETPFYKDRDNYIKLAGLLILLGLGYYY